MNPVPEFERCKNCHGTGTVFRGKTLQAKGSKCPVCKGACKTPIKKDSQ